MGQNKSQKEFQKRIPYVLERLITGTSFFEVCESYCIMDIKWAKNKVMKYIKQSSKEEKDRYISAIAKNVDNIGYFTEVKEAKGLAMTKLEPMMYAKQNRISKEKLAYYLELISQSTYLTEIDSRSKKPHQQEVIMRNKEGDVCFYKIHKPVFKASIRRAY